jgi:hypothetical protein
MGYNKVQRYNREEADWGRPPDVALIPEGLPMVEDETIDRRAMRELEEKERREAARAAKKARQKQQAEDYALKRAGLWKN